ncbi:hypothetical protein KR038_005036 [Drosophila bunnanda]|nr:hypothetical protein KR038_005036 [Drosophila bunnanda]
MRKIYLLLLMAQIVVSSRNFNQILDRDEWINIAKEYIRNHKPYKVKTYEPYKPQIVNITNSFGGEFWESTVSPDPSTEEFSTTESTLLPTTTSGDTDYMETTTSAFSTAIWSTTESSIITTESPETSTIIQTTTEQSVFEKETTSLEALVDQAIQEPPETTTEVLLSTTENPEISTSTDEGSTPFYTTSTEPTPSTAWPWFYSTQSSDITTESIISTEPQEMSTLIETTTHESTTSSSLEDQTTQTSTFLLDIISTTPGFETTTTYLSESTEETYFTTETTPPGFNFTNQAQEATTEALKPTTTTKRAGIVEDAIRPKKRKMKYTSDTEPEISWD